MRPSGRALTDSVCLLQPVQRKLTQDNAALPFPSIHNNLSAQKSFPGLSAWPLSGPRHSVCSRSMNTGLKSYQSLCKKRTWPHAWQKPSNSSRQLSTS
jgi:hypothetical protein